MTEIDKKAGLGQELTAEESTRGVFLRAREGDFDARERLWRRLIPRLRKFAHGRLPGAARDLLDTDDLVQEVLLKTLRAVDRFDPQHSGALGGYLRDALVHRICDEVRRVERRSALCATWSDLADPSPSPIEEAIAREKLERYESGMSRLEPEERELIHCRLELGLEFSEIAQLVGKPSSDAARMATQRALRRLAQEIPR